MTMDSQYPQALVASRMGRRSLLKRAGLLGIALPLTGGLLGSCNSDDKTSTARIAPTQPASSGEAVAATGAVTELTVTQRAGRAAGTPDLSQQGLDRA
jgi:hypothetical protein